MTLDRLAVSGTGRAPAGRRLLLLGLATLLPVLALACGADGDDEAPSTAAALTGGGGGVTTATPPVPTTAPEVTGEDLAVAVWGARTCALARSFAIDFTASGDPRDPDGLPLEERKQRADAMFPVQMDAVNVALGELELIESPERTADLHALLRQRLEDLLQALGDQRLIIEAASSTEEIAFSNREVNDLLSLAFRKGVLLENAGYC